MGSVPSLSDDLCVSIVFRQVYLKEEVKTSMLPYSAKAPSSVRPTEARGGLLKTALATFS